MRGLEATFRVECGTNGCCGCVSMIYIHDEKAYRANCNECGKIVGYAKEAWDNKEDRERLGRRQSHHIPTLKGGN